MVAAKNCRRRELGGVSVWEKMRYSKISKVAVAALLLLLSKVTEKGRMLKLGRE
jgi:hypothetical protein